MRKRFIVDGNEYFLEFTMENIEKLENALGMPVTSIIQTVPTIAMLRILIGESLKTDNGRVSRDRGIKISGEIIKECGLSNIYEHIVECIVEDCGFLFN